VYSVLFVVTCVFL